MPNEEEMQLQLHEKLPPNLPISPLSYLLNIQEMFVVSTMIVLPVRTLELQQVKCNPGAHAYLGVH